MNMISWLVLKHLQEIYIFISFFCIMSQFNNLGQRLQLNSLNEAGMLVLQPRLIGSIWRLKEKILMNSHISFSLILLL